MKQRLFSLALNVGLGLGIFGSAPVQAVPLQPAAVGQSTPQSASPPAWYNCLTREAWTPEKQAWCNKLKAVQNATYTLPDAGSISLTNGIYENPAQEYSVRLANQEGLINFGDINKDGVEDAVVLLSTNGGGTGQYIYMAAVLDVNGDAQPLLATFLGDRIRINAISIKDNQVTVNLLIQKPDDPACCPTQAVTRVYAMQPSLVQVSRDPAEPSPLPSTLPSTMSSMLVKGTVSYLQRIALPPSAVIEVSLLDVSRQDTPAEIISTETIRLDGRQVPVPFALSYDSEQIDPRRTYAVQARILVDGQLRFVNTSSYPVITQGHPTTVDVLVQSAN
ncbi:YbaY family lipoprotein [Phormidium tenue FACHB-886]|nr:YbaY family lipoprotein [Phormidium tenue FACHB-886]